jgi:hypothetical protein
MASKFSIKGMVIPLRSNELLGRLLILPFNCRSRLPAPFIQLDSLWMRSGLTPELTGRAHNAITDNFTMKDRLTRAPVE